jgi:hypothetical protein
MRNGVVSGKPFVAKGATTYGIDPALERLFPGGGKKKKPGDVSTFGIGEDLVGFESMIPGQSEVSDELYNALVDALQGKFPEEYFSSAIAGPLRRVFEQETLPGIGEAHVGPGTFWGTARAGAEVKGRTRMEEDIASRRAELAYQTQQQALQAALAYLGLPLLAAYQPYDEGGGGGPVGAGAGGGGAWGSSIQRALAKPKPPKLLTGPIYTGGAVTPYAGPTSSF